MNPLWIRDNSKAIGTSPVAMAKIRFSKRVNAEAMMFLFLENLLWVQPGPSRLNAFNRIPSRKLYSLTVSSPH